MPTPLDVIISGSNLKVVGTVIFGGFYVCRDGTIVGPIINGEYRDTEYAAALGGDGESWSTNGWNNGNRDRDLVCEIEPPLIWTGREWTRAPAQ